MILPANPYARRHRKFTYDSVESVVLMWPGPFERLAIDVGWIVPMQYRAVWFEDPDALTVIENEIRQRVGDLPDGAARLRKLELRRRVGDAASAHAPHVTLAAAAVIVFVGFLQAAMGSFDDANDLTRHGAMGSWLIADGGSYRLVTSAMLHAAWWHLMMNLCLLLVLGYQVEGLVGSWRYAALLLGGGLLGAVPTAWCTDELVVGSSIALFGLFGALFVLNLMRREMLPGPYRWTIRWAMVGILPMVLMSVSSTRISHLGHAFGFVAGALVCLAVLPGLDLTRPRARPAAWIRWAALVLIGLYVAGIAQGVRFAVTSDAWDVIRIARRSLDRSGLSPPMRLVLADWISHAPGASEADLKQGLELARQARSDFADVPLLVEAAESLEESFVRRSAGGALAREQGLGDVEHGPEEVEDGGEERLAH